MGSRTFACILHGYVLCEVVKHGICDSGEENDWYLDHPKESISLVDLVFKS